MSLSNDLLSLRGKLHKSVWRNPFLTKGEHAAIIGVHQSELSAHWKALKEARIAELEAKEANGE